MAFVRLPQKLRDQLPQPPKGGFFCGFDSNILILNGLLMWPEKYKKIDKIVCKINRLLIVLV